MRYIRYALLGSFAVALIAVALANSNVVTLKVLPEDVAAFVGMNASVDLPLFIVILGGILVGLLVGFVWEWVREYGQRADAARQAREMRRLEREVARLKGEKHEGKDEVLALLDEAS
ncbi:MAG TPA: LapA family protein [Paracoccaceae bacterium]|nr:LapA family protein [Paracoccaceae bacterium]